MLDNHALPIVLEPHEGRLTILGTPIFQGKQEDLLEAIERLLETGQPELVITPNVDQLIELQTNRALQLAYSSASLLLADGSPIVALARRMGFRSIERNTGADLLPFLAENASHRLWKIGIAGGRAGVAERAADRLNHVALGTVVAIDFPKVDVGENRAQRTVEIALDRLNDSGANIFFLCLGSPKQEIWYLENRDKLPPGVYVGAGAAVDFAAGVVVRAPVALQKVGGEWLWRLFQEPRRLFHRYLIRGPRFVYLAIRSLKGAGKPV
ncbi:WecB/TagA/CpsF family glycosyltransferase [Leucobacter denitrificans]|uniref:WecB/TagA/CpsF family glycosyltransferase n=1 Tax=Leucobacter denitrificans TaxID=683042 RepID=A0A7G9S796_9MICO|nr:WecB/TagA/CpsF family glycosyltransferase [Leucobacter denitrificans]QNN63721.1 WecB/TagA/CpsF family glycosyltransferase [Leucobacter denitrificans]